MAPQHPLADHDRWRRVERLAGDASTRGYTRLEDRRGRSWILSEYPGESRLFLGRDLEVLSWLAGRGLRVPAVLDHDLPTVGELGEAILDRWGRPTLNEIAGAIAFGQFFPTFKRGLLHAQACEPVLAELVAKPG